MKKRLKVVWLCRLNLNYYKHIIKAKTQKGHPITWITNLVDEIIKQDIFDLHLITTSSCVNRNVTFSVKNVTFYVICRKIPFYYVPTRLFRYFPLLKRISDYYCIKRSIKIIKKINPDIVNSHGTENEDSLPLLKLHSYPKVVNIQGFYNSGIKLHDTPKRRKLLEIENEILRTHNNFIIRSKPQKDIIVKYNKSANFYYNFHPINKIAYELYEKKIEKDADLIYVAGICKNKGIEDLILSLAIVKKTIPDIKLKVVGFGDSGYIHYIKELVLKTNVSENVQFLGFLENKDALLEMKKSNVYVLPTYFDTSPMTIIESMALGVPVVSYNVDGIPYMVENNYSGLLVEKGNIKQLSDAIIKILQNVNLKEELIRNAKNYIQDNYDPEKIIQKQTNIYYSILENEKV